MLKNGQKAPDFPLPREICAAERFSALLEAGPVILYFYPADFTPVCTRQACMLRDFHADLAAAGMRVLDVSPQDAERHRQFRQRHDLGFPLVPDPEKRIIRAYDADGPWGFGVRRVSYLVGSNGVILDGVVADLRLGKHAAFVRRALRARAAEKPDEPACGRGQDRGA